MGLYEHEGIDQEELKTKCRTIREIIISQIYDMKLKDLVFYVMEKYGLEFCESVGSATKHHNYPGGLVDHTLEVVKLAKAIGECFPGKVNMDLVITGAFLHDLGKIVCYEDAPNLKSGKRPKKRFQNSVESKVMGHFGEVLTMLEELINDLELVYNSEHIIDNHLKRQLYHIIASHHGEARLNWGSITDPYTNEAHIVALADLLSSRIKA